MRKFKLTPLLLAASVFGLSACTLPKWLSFLSFIPGLDAPTKEEEEEDIVPLDHTPRIKEQYGNYRLATSLVEGKDYILGVYRHEKDQMRFFNGDYHWDGSFYPYYMGTDLNSTEGAAKIRVEFKNENEFALKVTAEGVGQSGEAKPWNNKYIGVYSAYGSGGSPVMSIALLDTPDQTEYYQPGDDSGEATDPTYGYFKFYDKCDGATVYAPAADYKHTEDGDSKAVPKFLGTAGTYTSIDCKDHQTAVDGLAYDLAHLYEAIE